MEKKQNVLYGVILVTTAGILLAYLYRLKLSFGILLILAEAAALPRWIQEKRKQEKAQKRFTEVNIYLEQVLYSFRKSGKILAALIDVEKLFPEGKMANCIHQAVTAIRETYQGEQIMENALKIIETEYPAQRVIYAHRLMLKAERLGGNCEDSIRILLKDRDMWEKETLSYRKRSQAQKRNIIAAILLSALMCLMTPILCQTSLKEVSVTEGFIYQITTLLMLLSAMGIYLCTEKYFAKDWILDGKCKDEKSSVEKYEKVVNYDVQKARKKSLLWAAAAAMIVGILMLSKHFLLAVLFSPVVIFMLFQHRIDYALAKKSVIHEIRKAFPDWLMEVSLLLQTENVANSIQKSIPFAPAILKPELELLVQRLEVTPESNFPYSQFLQTFSIPEVSSAMGMLYSLSDGGGADAGIQIEEILERNAQWQKDAEILANQDKLGKMYVLFLVPALLGALKMVVDMTLILLAFFNGIHG